MLVRRSVENDLRFFLGEDSLQTRQIADIGDDGSQREGGVIRFQFQQRLEDAVFAMPQQNQLRRIPARRLTAEFPADGAARARDQNPLPRQRLADAAVVQMRGFPPQQV